MNKVLAFTVIAIATAVLPLSALAYEKAPTVDNPARAPMGLKLPAQKASPSNNWLQDADSDADRFKKLEIYLRGFDQPMLEVGERYQRLYDAIKDKNWELADYQWDKTKWAINTGLMKRPKRTQNAEGIFLDGIWKQMDQAIKAKDYKQMKKEFMVAREACMACHVAENVAFMNNRPLFRDLRF
ncbi:MAG: hypothetical protein A2X71_07250 [Thiobacillus sp. GWE1_62_9]|nr:MAG: hypothetical protein A2X71_07250 [Thiobacillus sp. GWE1_62_9]HBU28727.1 hypothetical protein [Thiobacillus sp.]